MRLYGVDRIQRGNRMGTGKQKYGSAGGDKSGSGKFGDDRYRRRLTKYNPGSIPDFRTGSEHGDTQGSGQDQTTGENQETGKDQTSGGNAGNADASQTTGTEFTEDKDGNQTGEEGQTPETQDVKEEIAVAAEGASIRYQAHVQTYGWIKEAKDGKEEGTTGQSKRVESLKINVDSAIDGNVEYRAFIQEVGWTDWKSNGAEVGTTGQSKRLEALQVRLTGKLAEQYDVYYSVHAQTYGWLDWAKNGDTSGTVGLDKRLESVKIVLVAKGGQAPGSHYDPEKNPGFYRIQISCPDLWLAGLGRKRSTQRNDRTQQTDRIPPNWGTERNRGWHFLQSPCTGKRLDRLEQSEFWICGNRGTVQTIRSYSDKTDRRSGAEI